MRTVWEYLLETESRRLVHESAHLANGFFKANHFLVLPYSSKLPADNCSAFPDLPYLSVPRFWDRCSRINTHAYNIQIPADLLADAERLLSRANLPQPDWSKVQAQWTKSQTKIISEIYKLIPSKKGWIKKVIIYPTAYGTTCSFNLLTKPGTVKIWLRVDQGVGAIVEAILSAITRADVYEQLNGLWQESEIIVDWLIAYSSLSKLLPDKPATIKHPRSKQNAALIQVSQNFLRKIGAPEIGVSAIKELDSNGFTSREKQLLDLLLSRSPALVTIDEIGDLLFKSNPDQFSLYAIAKTIQRLRDKLESHGISGSFIQTKRGEGYLLIN